MSEFSISQDELDKLFSQSRTQTVSAKKPTNFSSDLILKKFAQDEDRLKRQLSELRITVTQEEVDALF